MTMIILQRKRNDVDNDNDKWREIPFCAITIFTNASDDRGNDNYHGDSMCICVCVCVCVCVLIYVYIYIYIYIYINPD